MSQENTSVALENKVLRRVEQRIRKRLHKSLDDCVNRDLGRYYRIDDLAEEGFREYFGEAELFLLDDACRHSYMWTLSTPNGISGYRSQAGCFRREVEAALQNPDLLKRHPSVNAVGLLQKLEAIRPLEVLHLAEWLESRINSFHSSRPVVVPIGE